MTQDQVIEQAITLGQQCSVENWMELKKLLLVSLPPKERTKFSRRDSKTKKQMLNDFEQNLIDNYYSRTGMKLKDDNDV